MGAWGPGLQANDTAWDATGGWKRELRQVVKKRDAKAAAKLLAEIHKWLDGRYEAWGILGAAEWLLDHAPHTILAKAKPLLEKAVKLELSKRTLECWENKEERKHALELFRRRLKGEQVQEDEVEASNEGLLSRLARGAIGNKPLDGNQHAPKPPKSQKRKR